MGESLACYYRPQSFSEVLGQDTIIKILTKQLKTNSIKNCYLFAGSSGCGKTTIARIFANEINNGEGNPIEIDAASNNGVDNIRDIILDASKRSISGKYKVFILDEAHMLTNSSWNALLKTIEEPPQYTIFIFCTTDPQKIPNTILNRVMRFNFNKIDSRLINERLVSICENEGFKNYKDTCDYISRICNGGMRDAISMLEKCSDYDSDITLSNCLLVLGNNSYDTFFNLINAIIDRNSKEALRITDDIINTSIDLKSFIDRFISFCIDLMKYVLFKDCGLTSLPASNLSDIEYTCNFEGSHNFYQYVINKLYELKNQIKNDSDIKSSIEVCMLNLSMGK